MSFENQPYGFLVGFDLKDNPPGAHEAIIKDILKKYERNDNARRILDTTWIIRADSTVSQTLYKEIQTIIKKHNSIGKYYLTIWKIDFNAYWECMRAEDRVWFKNKFGL